MARQFSRKIKRYAWQRCGGLCEGALPDGSRCGAPLTSGHINYDHRDPWEFSRDSSLGNCQVLCDPCDDRKTYKQDIPAIRKSDRIRDKHVGAFRRRGRLPCGRDSRLSKPIFGPPKPRLTLAQKLAQTRIGREVIP